MLLSARKFNWLAIFILLAAVFAGCEDDPTSLGENLLPGDDFIKYDSIDTRISPIEQHSSYYFSELNNSSATKTLLGKANGIEAKALLRFVFNLPDSIESTLSSAPDSLEIVEAKMLFAPKYVWGDSMSTLDLSIYTTGNIWNSDSVAKYGLDSVDVLYDKSIAEGYSEGESKYTVDMNRDTVKAWMFDAINNSSYINNGILIEANSGNKIIGIPTYFSGDTESRPKLQILLNNKGIQDTVITDLTTDLHFVESDGYYVENSIVVQGGVSRKGQLYFSMKDIPQTAVISEAILELTVNETETIDGNPETEQIVVALFADSSSNDPLVYSSLGYQYLDRSEENRNIFAGDIAAFMQLWINGFENQGIRLNIANETSNVSRIVFYGSEAETSLRPRLKLKYYVKE